MPNKIADRIKVVMIDNQLTASSFAEQLGVQRSGISHILSGRNKPSLDFVEKILKEFPEVDAAWLITGNKADKPEQGQKEEPEPDRKDKSAEAVSKLGNTDLSTGKTVLRIAIFYSDNTFEEFFPSSRNE